MKLTDQQKKDICTALKQYAVERGTPERPLSLKKISHETSLLQKGVKVGISYLSDLMSGKLTTGGKDVLIDDKYFYSVAELIGFRIANDSNIHHDTADFMECWNVFEDARNMKLPSVIDGSTRFGKSYSAQEYKKKAHNSHYVFLMKCDGDLTAKGFMEELAEVVGVQAIGSGYKIRKAIVRKIKQCEADPILIIDEGENLKDNSWNSVKSMMDDLKGICPIVIIGANGFKDTLERKAAKNKGCFPQIIGRIEEGLGFHLLNGISSVEDVSTICRAYGITNRSHVNTFFDNCSSIGILTRKVKLVIKESKELQTPITPDFIKAIAL